MKQSNLKHQNRLIHPNHPGATPCAKAVAYALSGMMLCTIGSSGLVPEAAYAASMTAAEFESALTTGQSVFTGPISVSSGMNTEINAQRKDIQFSGSPFSWEGVGAINLTNVNNLTIDRNGEGAFVAGSGQRIDGDFNVNSAGFYTVKSETEGLGTPTRS